MTAPSNDEKTRLQEYKKRIEEALYSGLRQVSFEGESTTFQSINEMQQVLAQLESKLNESTKKRFIRMVPVR